MAKNSPTNIAIGKNKGHPVTKIQARRTRPVSSKGRIGKRTKMIRQVVDEVSGVSTYEKRVVELLKAGSLKDTKKALLAAARKELSTPICLPVCMATI